MGAISRFWYIGEQVCPTLSEASIGAASVSAAGHASADKVPAAGICCPLKFQAAAGCRVRYQPDWMGCLHWCLPVQPVPVVTCWEIPYHAGFTTGAVS